MAKRRRRGLADIGPATRKLTEIRDGIRGVRKALDRGSCQDAAALMRLTEREIEKLQMRFDNPIDPGTRASLREEKVRLKSSCNVNFASRRRRRRRRR